MLGPPYFGDRTLAKKKEVINTKIWNEEAEKDNPFAAAKCYCSGYDVYGDLLGKVSWIEYLYLLFKLELPTKLQAQTLETIAVAIANPGIRDHSVRAAMNAGVGGSTRASALMAALAVGAGNLNGGREVLQMVRLWESLGTNLDSWVAHIKNPPSEERIDVWLPMEHIPGFDPNGASCPLPVQQTLEALVKIQTDGKLAWLQKNRAELEQQVGYPLAMSGVIAAGLVDLDFNEAQAEILYLLLRLPGAAAHALEQEHYGWRRYPFFGDDIKPMPDQEYQQLMKSLETK